MTERAYTIYEIDQMRGSIYRGYGYQMRHLDSAEKASAVEDRLRTYIPPPGLNQQT